MQRTVLQHAFLVSSRLCMLSLTLFFFCRGQSKSFHAEICLAIPPQSCFYVFISSERIWKPGFYTKQESNLLSSTPPPAELLYTHHHAFLDQNWYELNTTINCMKRVLLNIIQTAPQDAYMHVQNIQLFSFTFSTVKMLLGLSYSLFSLLVHVHLCDKKKCMSRTISWRKSYSPNVLYTSV